MSWFKLNSLIWCFKISAKSSKAREVGGGGGVRVGGGRLTTVKGVDGGGGMKEGYGSVKGHYKKVKTVF